MEMEQQFSLSWNNFHGNLSKGFAGLLGNGEFVDVTIAVEGHLLQAHKVILSICSPYFKKMFQMNPCQHPIVVLRDVTHKAMRDLLQFMYHGEVSVKREDLTSFIGTAEVLQIKGLTNKQTDDECIGKEQELPKNSIETQNSTPDVESCTSETFEGSGLEEMTHNDFNLIKQRQFLEKLQRFSSLKRKSDEYLQKNYYASELFHFDKRTKKDKTNKNENLSQNSSYDQTQQAYNETPLDITTKSDTSLNIGNYEENDKKKLDPSLAAEMTTDLKTESEDTDIVVTDPSVCTTPKSYEISRENQKDQLEYQSPQDNALSLVVNGSCENPQLPVRYKYIYSRKGHKQLVHMNFVYTKHSTSHGKTAWRCVQYFSLNRCPATVETIDAMIYAINHQHNHEDCYEKLSKNNIYYEMSDTK